MFKKGLTRNICSDILFIEQLFLFEGVGKMNKRLVIKSKLRFVIFLLSVLMFSVTLINVSFGADKASYNQSDNYIEIEVSSGDTLWDIANTYCDYSSDTRKVVHEICLINDIKASDLKEGMTIKIPTNLEV